MKIVVIRDTYCLRRALTLRGTHDLSSIEVFSSAIYCESGHLEVQKSSQGSTLLRGWPSASSQILFSAQVEAYITGIGEHKENTLLHVRAKTFTQSI